MSNPHNPDALKEARKALAVADTGNDVPERWHVYCEFGHHVSTWDHDPGEDGRRQRCLEWNGTEECSESTDGAERYDNDVKHVHGSHYEPKQVDKEHLRAALAEIDRLTEEIGTMTGLFRDEVAAQRVAHQKHIAGIREKLDGVRAERDTAIADLAALHIEHKTVCGLLTHTRQDRDEARKERDEARRALTLLRGDAPPCDKWSEETLAAIRAVDHAPTPVGRATAPVVILGDGNDLHRLAQAPRGALDREALDDMPTLDLTAWIDAPMATPPNRAQRRAKDKR